MNSLSRRLEALERARDEKGCLECEMQRLNTPHAGPSYPCSHDGRMPLWRHLTDLNGSASAGGLQA